MPDNTSHQVNLLDFIAFIGRWRKFLLAAVLSVTIVVGVISFLVPPKYRSTAVIRGTESNTGELQGFLAARLSELGNIGFAPAMGELPGELAIAVLKTRWISELVIDSLELRSVYRMEKSPIEDVIAVFAQRTHFELDARSQTVEVHADDRDPQRAQAITQLLVDALDSRNQELRSYNARREREFTGQRLAEARSTLASLEDSLARFQLLTGVLNLEEQVKATISAVASLEAQRLVLKTELEMQQQIYEPGRPEIRMLRLQIASLDSSIQDLMRKRQTEDSRTDYLLRFQDTPEAGLEYLRLMRDIEIQQILVGVLIQQYEQARITENRNTPTLMRLDSPTVATKRVWPRRGLMTGVAAFCAFVFGVAIALVSEFLKAAAANPSHPAHAPYQRLRDGWRQ